VKDSVDLLIVGAGPFGLAVAAHAEADGLDYLIVGEPMGFWRGHMPAGMLLRSGPDWHLDPFDEYTLERYLREREIPGPERTPLTRDLYLDYVQWFQERRGIVPVPVWVDRLDGSDGRFVATHDDGMTVTARRVVLALGMGYFAHTPAEVADLVPAGRAAHTCDAVDFEALAGKRCLILGGRQSAFEWAALIREAGASHVHVSHRHASPAFVEADWDWVPPLVDAMVDDPGWFRRLPADRQAAVSQRLWAEGRLKVEPWLKDRIEREGISIWPHSQVAGCRELASGDLEITFADGSALTVDEVIFATGYKVDLARIPLLANGNILQRLEIRDGFPVLDEHFESSVPGLFITSMPAAQDFGPFFGFTVSARASARLIAAALS
jgi:cation diffusion facilitator CzcD-associated flavoprotein CzcO